VTAGVAAGVADVVGLGSADGPIGGLSLGPVSDGAELGLAKVTNDGGGDGSSDEAGALPPMYEQPTTITTTTSVGTNRAHLTAPRTIRPVVA
jgi:hypothetical protein